MLKNKRKGVSIIEILIALTLLTVISIIFSSVMLKNYEYLRNSKKLTVNSFDSVKKIERLRVTTKEQIKANTAPEPLSISLFTGTDMRTIAYHELSVDVKNTKGEANEKGKLVTYVGDRTKSTTP